LHQDDDSPRPVHSKPKRLDSVVQVSKQAYAIAGAKPARRTTKK
jgi:hypothetical protein